MVLGPVVKRAYVGFIMGGMMVMAGGYAAPLHFHGGFYRDLYMSGGGPMRIL